VDRARRVLVVDDDPLLVGLTAEMVEELGCDVRTARNGIEALDRLAGDQKIEILITDIDMPGMSGYELAGRAKQIKPDLQILLLSGRESDTPWAAAHPQTIPTIRPETGYEPDNGALLTEIAPHEELPPPSVEGWFRRRRDAGRRSRFSAIADIASTSANGRAVSACPDDAGPLPVPRSQCAPSSFPSFLSFHS
jgi:CheY-like chemotaxis protein